MADEENLLSTPSNYATPSQIANVRDYAKALLYGHGQQPVKHWTQGLSNIVSALVGGSDLYKADKQDRASDLFDAGKAPRVPGDTGQASPVGTFSDPNVNQMFRPPNYQVPDSSAGIDQNMLNRIVKIESGGNPRATTGSYKGLLQLSDPEFKKYGGTGDIYDPEANMEIG